MRRLLATALFVCALNFVCAGLASAQEPILGEVRLFGFNFCPRGWAPANGQLLAVSSNAALFSLYGTIYGGNGTSTFGLPNLIGRAPVNAGTGPLGQPLGALYGQSMVTLTVGQLPAHRHTLFGTKALDQTTSPAGTLLPTFNTGAIYSSTTAAADTPMKSDAIGLTGSNQPVSTQSPSLAMNWCVATVGIYPSRN
jgi:microcystin-dependent protein